MNKNAVASPLKLSSARWSDDTPVIQGRRIRSDLTGAANPLFGEDRWDLQAIVHRNNALRCNCILDFSRFTDPLRRMTAKELVMQRLNFPLPTTQRKGHPIAVSSASNLIYLLQEFYSFMDRRGVARLSDISEDDLNVYAREVTASGRHVDTHRDKINVVRWLHGASEFLTHDQIAIQPWQGRVAAGIVGQAPRGENKTPRIPEETMGPLLRWALAYVERFSDDIIAAWGDLNRTKEELANRSECKEGEGRSRVEDWIESCRQNGRRLPGSPKKPGFPNIERISRLCGLSNKGLTAKYLDLVMAAASELGIDHGSLGSKVSTLPETGMPWRPDFSAETDVRAECRSLIAACYIVCAYLSGMRDSEVQAIRCGAYRPVLDENGEVVRHKLESTAFKGEDSEEGLKRDWVVIKPVATAINVLERLTESIRRDTGTEFLFLQMWGDPKNPSLKSSVNYHLNRFVEWINDKVQPRLAGLDLPSIPMGSKEEPLRLSTKMFRRTVAWHIANRPFGIVAGMIQYGHACEMTFEGYAGASECGFRSEVEAEREMARKADLLDMYEDHKRGVKPSGPMGEELGSEFENIQKTIGDFPGKVVDEKRREKMLEHLRVRLHPGLMADCFFEAKEASCLRHLDEKERKQPVAGICDPHCQNACWLKKHLPVWEHAATDVQRLAGRNRISPIQRQILKDKAKEYKGVIQSIKEASRGCE